MKIINWIFRVALILLIISFFIPVFNITVAYNGQRISTGLDSISFFNIATKTGNMKNVDGVLLTAGVFVKEADIPSSFGAQIWLFVLPAYLIAVLVLSFFHGDRIYWQVLENLAFILGFVSFCIPLVLINGINEAIFASGTAFFTLFFFLSLALMVFSLLLVLIKVVEWIRESDAQ